MDITGLLVPASVQVQKIAKNRLSGIFSGTLGVDWRMPRASLLVPPSVVLLVSECLKNLEFQTSKSSARQ